MAVTVTNQSNPLAAKIVQDTATTNTAVDNTTGASGTLYMVEIDNTAYATIVYFKLADSANATAGTTAPSIVLKCPASKKRSYVFPEGIAFSSGFSHWCTTGAAQTDTGAPGTVVVRYVTS